MSSFKAEGNVFAHRQALYELASVGAMGARVLDVLLPGGLPLEYEREMWDYKLHAPHKEKGKKLEPAEIAEFDSAICGIIKDAAAFHNSYGGYILLGVEDSPRRVVGFDGEFDCDEFNKRLKAFTGRSIQCCFEKLKFRSSDGLEQTVGLIYIPKRIDGDAAVQFLKDATQGRAKPAFGRNDIYLREGDECIPATKSEHFSFLFTPGRRVVALERHVTQMPILDTNLGPRDPGFIEFVGRESYISELWKWLGDRFNPVKLLAGIGGVGKTALAREFSEQVSRAAPFEFQKIVWLSAKKQFYTAIQGKYIASTRVDFQGTDELLRQVCLELGAMESDVPEDASREQLVEATIETLKVVPALIVVDDLDSLEPDQQQDTFHALLTIFGQTIGRSAVGSRALLTSRLDLGAGPAQVIRVKGLIYDEFLDYVHMTSHALDLNLKFDRGAKRTERFHNVTEGSPTFASSVLRLVSLGESLDAALSKWQNADGEDVRRFAFQRELEQLSDAARSTLYALSILSESNLLEISQILTRTEQQVRDDFSELRRYHLISHSESHLPGGNRISVPSGIRMMRSILKEKVNSPRRIEASCAKAKSQGDGAPKDIGHDVRRVVSLWSAGEFEDALSHAIVVDRQRPNHPDAKCLLGRSYLQLEVPDARMAEINLRAAYDLECDRPELISLWIRAKELLGDWNGILDITSRQEIWASDPGILLARVNAVESLAEINLRAGDARSAAHRFRSSADEITNILNRNQGRGALGELKNSRSRLLVSYFQLTKDATSTPDDYIDVWIACCHCFDSYVRSADIMGAGFQRLQDWWRAVERRRKPSEKTAGFMRMQLEKAQAIKSALQKQVPLDAVLVEVYSTGIELLRQRLDAKIGLL